MIFGKHAVIRTLDADDAAALKALYDESRVRSWMLDRRREPVTPTRAELREILIRKDNPMLNICAVEDRQGRIRGFSGLRGVLNESAYGEFVSMFAEDADYASPIASEALCYHMRQAFVQHRLNKLTAHTLTEERPLKVFLENHGFESDGVQREVLFSAGRWHDLETLSLFKHAALERYGETYGFQDADLPPAR